MPSIAAGHYVVAKYTPMNQDGDCGKAVFVLSDSMVESKCIYVIWFLNDDYVEVIYILHTCIYWYLYSTDGSPQKERKVRGPNKNKKVASLKLGEKLDVVFYNNRPVGKNHETWSRHLGKIVRDRNICPVRVQSWNEIENREKQHMWEAVKVKPFYIT